MNKAHSLPRPVKLLSLDSTQSTIIPYMVPSVRMKRGTFEIIITCILHIATEMCSTNILVTSRDYGETPALVTRGVFTSTRGKGVLADRHPGSSGLSPPMANGRLSTPRCTTLATQQRLRKNPCPHSFEGGNQEREVNTLHLSHLL